MCSGMTFGGHHPPANYVLFPVSAPKACRVDQGQWSEAPFNCPVVTKRKISCDFEEYSSDLGALSGPADCLLTRCWSFMVRGMHPWDQAALHQGRTVLD